MKIVSVIIGVLIFLSMKLHVEVESFLDVLQTFVVLLFPTLLILVPIIITYLEFMR